MCDHLAMWIFWLVFVVGGIGLFKLYRWVFVRMNPDMPDNENARSCLDILAFPLAYFSAGAIAMVLIEAICPSPSGRFCDREPDHPRCETIRYEDIFNDDDDWLSDP